MKIIVSMLLLSSLLLPNQAPGPEEIKFTGITINEGLSQNTVYCSFRDLKGFMWFGTEKGLNRYDGHGFKVYVHDPENSNSLGYDMVLSIFESPREPGILWIGTGGGGLDRFDTMNNTFHHFVNDDSDPGSINSNNIRCISQDSNGDIWIGTESGISIFNRSKSNFKNFMIDSGQSVPVLSIQEMEEGKLLLGTWGKGIYMILTHKKKIIPFCMNKDIEEIRHSQIRALLIDREGDIWAGTSSKGLYQVKIDKNGRCIYKNFRSGKGLNCNIIRDLNQDRFGFIWIATHGGGINRFDPRSGISSFHTHSDEKTGSISNNIVLNVFEDKEGLVWAGTFGGGVNKYHNKKSNFEIIRFSQNIKGKAGQNSISSLYTDSKGNILVGSMGSIGSSIGYIDTISKTIKYFPIEESSNSYLSGNIIFSIIEVSEGKFWLGTWGKGLFLLDTIKGNIIKSDTIIKRTSNLKSQRILSLQITNSGDLLEGTWGDGLNIIRHDLAHIDSYKNDPEDPHSLSNDKVRAVHCDNYNNIWIGTEKGLNKFDPDNKSFIRYLHRKNVAGSLSHNIILSIFSDKAGQLWIGTEQGLNLYDRKMDQFKHFGIESGIHGESIYGILEDRNGNLWISTNKGLNKFEKETGHFLNFDVRKNVSKYEFSLAHTLGLDGKMYFGSVEGIIVFSPEKVKQDLFKPEIILTSFKKFGKEVYLRQNISALSTLEISYSDKIFSFDVSSLSFANSAKNKYKYKLEGLIDEWIDLNNKHTISFSKLDPGSYILKVKGTNSDGVWNDSITSLKLIITPPFWQTWWFRFVIIILILILIQVWHRTRMSRLKQRLRSEHALDILCRKKKISPREKEIIFLVIKGMSNKEIEEKLFISSHTVKNHIYNIFQKLDIKSRGQLMELFKNIYFSDKDSETQDKN